MKILMIQFQIKKITISRKMNFNKPKFVPQSFGQEIIDSFNQSCQLNLDGVHFLSTGTFQLNVLLVKMDIIYNSVH